MAAECESGDESESHAHADSTPGGRPKFRMAPDAVGVSQRPVREQARGEASSVGPCHAASRATAAFPTLAVLADALGDVAVARARGRRRSRPPCSSACTTTRC